MKKYLEILRLSFKTQIVWRFDVTMTMLATIGRIMAAWILWRAAFDGEEYISSFNFDSMLSYYIIASFLISLDISTRISAEIAYLIREGGFSKHMIMPVNPIGYFGFSVAGESLFHFGFSLIAAFACTFLFKINIVLNTNIVQILVVVFMIFLGLLFMVSFHCFLGMLAFKFISINSFLFAANSIISFMTGALVPLALLPDWIKNIMRLFPFYYVTYAPAMLLSGQYDENAISGIIIIAIWTAALLILSQFTYNKLRVQYDGVGI